MSGLSTSDNYYFRIDERQNTLDSLQKTRVFLSRVDEDEFYWKWAMIALHNAVYGSMVLALLGGNPERVKYSGKSGEEKVISFWEAFKRVQNPKSMRMYVGSKFACITPEAEKLKQNPEHTKKAGFFLPELYTSLEHLNNYIRNQFLHYYPVSISFGKGGFVEIVEDVTMLIEFLLLKSGNFRIDSDEENNFIKGEIFTILDSVAVLKKKHLLNEQKRTK